MDCEIEENATLTTGSFRLLRAEQEVARGTCGRPLEVPAGSYDVWVILDGAADAPTSRTQVDATAGHIVRARFETGELLVQVTRGGRRSVGQVKLRRGGQTVAVLSSGVAARVSVGTYGVEVEARGNRRLLDPVTVSRGERRAVHAELSADSAQASP